MKIAIFASDQGEKALHLHEFFKEGNRVILDIVYTDNPKAPIIEKMRAEGIEVVVLTPGSDGEQMAETLRNRDVELLVLDEFRGVLPSAVKEAYGEAIIEPSSPQNAPLEVITTVDRQNAALRNRQAEAHAQEVISREKEENRDKVSDADHEWAEVLEVDIDSRETPKEESPKINPPEYQDPQPQYREPFQTQYGPSPSGQGPTPPPYGQPGPQNVSNPSEPMPDTYLVWSVIITILCCLIPGIVAIIYSASVSSKYFRGDIEGAKRASRNAQIWCIISIVTGIIWATLYIPLSLLLP